MSRSIVDATIQLITLLAGLESDFSEEHSNHVSLLFKEKSDVVC